MAKGAAVGTKITDQCMETLRSQADIVQVVSDRVVLKRAGRRFSGLCPFHAEKSPSFFVDPERRMYHCFGCGAGGDVFSFVMESEGFSFPEAVRVLAERFGVPLQSDGFGKENTAKGERKAIFEANAAALNLFRHGLLKSPKGEIARKYLEKRDVSEASIRHFGLGFVPEGWSFLGDYLRKKGFRNTLLEKAGLVIRSAQGSFYDRFRNRIVFPIQDVTGKIIGFGGRSLGDEKPKYLNSPETTVYRKAGSLYGLRQARQEIRKKRVVYIVEGYLDVIALHQNGIPQAVAGLGTALTREQIQILRAYADTLVLVFDGDTAGIQAAERAAPLLFAQSVDARVFLLPQGEDPDTFVRSVGADAFLEAAGKAERLFPFLVRSALDRFGRTPEGRIRTLESLLSLLGSLEDPLVLEAYIRETADALDMGVAGIRERLETAKGRLLPSNSFKEEGAGTFDNAEREDRERLEEAMVSLLLSHPDYRASIAKLDPVGFFRTPVLKTVALFLLENEKAGPEEILANHTDPQVAQCIARLTFEAENWDIKSADLFIRQFQRILKQTQKEPGLMDRIKAAEEGQDSARLRTLLEQKQKQAREVAGLGSARAVTPRRHTP